MQPVSGMDVLKELRKRNQETVVIIFTAYSTVDSAIEALRLGAFDYLIKPAEPAAIRQRVEEGVKRYEQSLARTLLRDQLSTLQQTLQMINADVPVSEPKTSSDRILRRGDLVINLDSRHVRFAQNDLTLTTTEYKILVRLAESSPRPVDPVALAQAGLGYAPSQNEASELVKYHIHHLRQKIESEPEKPKHIKTIRYEGYVWCD
jgi:DNA-binding response OmpR family regulator